MAGLQFLVCFPFVGDPCFFYRNYKYQSSHLHLHCNDSLQHCIQLSADFWKSRVSPPFGNQWGCYIFFPYRLLGLLFLIIYMWKHVDKKQYGIHAVFDPRLSLHLLSISVWTMVRQFFCIAPWFLFFVAIEHLGECELAAANVVRSISMLFFVIVNSFATTTISLVSNLIGAKKPEQVMPTCRCVIALDYLIGVPLILLAFLFSDTLLGLFTNDAEIIRTAFYPYCVMLSTFIFSVPAYTCCNTVIGTGNTKIAFLFQMINIVVYLLYLFILSRSSNIPLAVYWTAEQLYVLVLLMLSLAYLKRNKWQNRIL